MLYGVLVDTLYTKEAENGQATFFFRFVNITAIWALFQNSCPVTCSDNYWPLFPQWSHHILSGLMQFFYNLIYFHVIPPKLINQLNCILIKFFFIPNGMTAKISSRHNGKRFVSPTTELLKLLYLFRRLTAYLNTGFKFCHPRCVVN